MKRSWSQVMRKRWLLHMVTAALLIILVGIGATYAYNQHETELENMLQASSVAGEIIENGNPAGESNWFKPKPGSETSKRVRFKNVGEAPVFVRVAFSESWAGNNNEWLANNYDYITLHWTNMWELAWELKDDGWYYYKMILPSGAMTDEVLTAVEFAPDTDILPAYQKARYQLSFTMEVLQYSEEEGVNNKALTKAFGRTATVAEGVVTWN